MTVLLPAVSLLLSLLPNRPAQDPMAGLGFLLGKWQSVETSKGPDGKEVTFTLKGSNVLILDGKALQIDENFEVGGQKMSNHIVMAPDRTAGKYRAYWFSSSRPGEPLVFAGERTEGKFLLTTTDDRVRIVYVLKREGEFSATLEVKRGDKWEIATAAEYKRTSN